MSFNLWACPIPDERPSPRSLYGIKHVLARAGYLYGENDGSLRTSEILFHKSDKRLMGFLHGLQHSSFQEIRECANTLFEMIEQNENGVRVWIGDWSDHGDPEPKGEDE